MARTKAKKPARGERRYIKLRSADGTEHRTLTSLLEPKVAIIEIWAPTEASFLCPASPEQRRPSVFASQEECDAHVKRMAAGIKGSVKRGFSFLPAEIIG